MKNVYYTLVGVTAIFTVLFLMTGCGTIGGAVDGAGDDLKRAGKYVKSIGKDDKWIRNYWFSP